MILIPDREFDTCSGVNHSLACSILVVQASSLHSYPELHMYHTRNLRTSSLRVIVKPVYLADTSPCSATRLTRNPYCANVYTSLAARLAKREEAACLFMIDHKTNFTVLSTSLKRKRFAES